MELVSLGHVCGKTGIKLPIPVQGSGHAGVSLFKLYEQVSLFVSLGFCPQLSSQSMQANEAAGNIAIQTSLANTKACVYCMGHKDQSWQQVSSKVYSWATSHLRI